MRSCRLTGAAPPASFLKLPWTAVSSIPLGDFVNCGWITLANVEVRMRVDSMV